MNALIIDPSRSYRKILSLLLNELGFNSIEAEGFESGLMQAQQKNFNVICMSVILKDGDSYELVTRIRACELNSGTPILLLTSSYKRDVIEKSYALGVTEVFRKKDFKNFEYYLGQFSEQLNLGAEVNGKILYVEDNRSVALVIRSMLEEYGHEVMHFVSAEEALLAYEEGSFDLVLTDVLLEGDMSGTSLARHIRHYQKDDKRRIPIVAVSAFSDDARRIELFRAGINDYVQKPVLEDELLARVNNLIHTQKLLCELGEQQKKLKEIALIDQLTGLYNRHYLVDVIPKLIAQSLRQNYPLSMMVIDIDHFKQVNDQHGHDMGDKVLAAVAGELKRLTRIEDILSRYGGEEFVLLLGHCALELAKEKAEKIRQAVDNLKTEGVHVTASFGVSFLREGEEYAALFSRADKAVYRAKELGRNRVEVE